MCVFTAFCLQVPRESPPFWKETTTKKGRGYSTVVKPTTKPKNTYATKNKKPKKSPCLVKESSPKKGKHSKTLAKSSTRAKKVEPGNSAEKEEQAEIVREVVPNRKQSRKKSKETSPPPNLSKSKNSSKSSVRFSSQPEIIPFSPEKGVIDDIINRLEVTGQGDVNEEAEILREENQGPNNSFLPEYPSILNNPEAESTRVSEVSF